MKKMHCAAAALAMALGIGAAMPAYADDADMTFDKIFRMADQNNNKMVTRQEFLDAMGKAYDQKMNAMKKDSKMVQGSEMTRDGLKSLIEDIYRGA